MAAAAGRPPGAAGEGDAGGQEDGVPPTGNRQRALEYTPEHITVADYRISKIVV